SVGFACWQKTSEFTGQVNIFEIKPDFRSKGIGTYFTNRLLEHLLEKNTYVVDLECMPEGSESFWRKLGFKDVPSNIHCPDRETKHLYKPLIQCTKEVLSLHGNNYIEIWDNEPYATKNKEPKWKWNITVNSESKLDLPIIQPCEKDWRIRLVLNNKVVIDDKIKRFGNVEIDHGSYAIIFEVPKIT
ncbi:MAG TPA: GNAT family N-acetyltransferase, partial [Flavisolibacter sp.]|nr:GNAT family N-acetyltransferase [Flavisolibacter sp.]